VRRRYRQSVKGQAANRRRNHERRAKTKGAAVVELVDPQKVFERDRWRCHLCRKVIPRRLFYPDRRSASVDHIVPLAEGGEHSYRNVAAAHLGCNLDKRTLPMGEQLRLLG